MAGRVASGAKPVVIQDLREVELASPHLRRRGIASLVAIPLRAEGRVIGVAHAGSVEPDFFDEDDLRLFELMADRLALALAQLTLFEAERAARRDAERAHRRLSFLAEASTILASSLDYQTTLRAVARLVVPHLADWCAVHIAQPDGGLERVALAHAELAAEELEGLDIALLRADPADPVGPAAVVRAGSAELVPEAGPDVRAMYGGDAAGAAELERLGFASYMCVPMHGRDRVLGAVTFATGDPERRFDEADLALAEELARRTAVAVENALLFREAEERGRAARVLAAVADGVFLVDAQGVLRLWNPAAEAITGLPAADVLNLPVAEAIPGWDTVSSRIGGGSVPAPPLGRRPCRSRSRGRELWLSISGVGFADGTVYAFRDLTQERALEELKGDFVSTVSHELRTPLAAIYGAAMTLQRPDLDDDTAANVRLLDVIARESERLATIVNDILLASRLDSNAVRVAIESFDAGELAESVIESAGVHRSGGDHAVTPCAAGAAARRRATPRRPARCSSTWSTTRSSTPRTAGGRDRALRRPVERALCRPRRGPRHRPRRAAAHLREVLPPRPEHDPRRRRHGPRPVHLPRARPAACRGGSGSSRPGAGGKGSTFAFELPLGTVPK